MARNKFDSCSIVLSVVDESGVNVLDCLGSVATKDHLSVFWTIFGPKLVVELYNFVVDVVIDVLMGYGAFKGDVAGCAEFCQFVCLFVSRESGVG